MVVFTLILVIGVLAAGSLFGYTVLSPIIKASRGRKVSAQLHISDFFSLTLVLVLPTLVVTTLRQSTASFVVVAAGIPAYTLTIWLWVRGAIKLSSTGVTSSLKRFVFLGLILPFAIFGSAVGIPMLCVGVISTPTSQNFIYPLLSIFGLLASVQVAIAGRLACRWVLNSTEQIEENDDGEDLSTD